MVLELLLWPHVNNLQRRIGQFHHVARFERFGVDVIHVVGMEYTRFGAIQNGLFTWGIGEAETAPTIILVSYLYWVARTSNRWKKRSGKNTSTYLGTLVGAHTIAMLSGIIT